MKFIEKLKWKVSRKNRNNKMQYIKKYTSAESIRILDIGVQAIRATSNKKSTTNYIEEYFLANNCRLDCLGLDDGSDWSYFKERYTNCNLFLFDGFNFPEFREKYDLALSNAVLEHVGTREQQLEWLKEICKICQTLIITTPNRYCPVESHTNAVFKHIFSRKFKQVLLSKHINLFSSREFIRILEEAGFKIKTVKRNRIFFFTIDFLAVCESSSSK